jgi:hypothetical protein
MRSGHGVILEHQLEEIAMTGKQRSVAEYVKALALEYGVSGEEGLYDRMARVISGLSGDDVELDGVEQLLVGLKRKGVIDGTEMLLL